MFSRWPKRYEWSMRAAVAVGWTGAAICGVGGAAFTASSVAAAVEPTWLLTGGSAMAAVGALMGFVGIVFGGFKRWPRAWRLEWIGSGLSGAGLVYYAIVPWIYVLDGHTERVQQAGALLAFLVGFIAFRMIHCVAYGHELTMKLDLQEAMEAGSGDA